MITSLKSHIRSDISGYNYLIDLFHQAKKTNDKFITFNFENTRWFEANLAAVLGAILELLNNEGKIVDVTNINSKITNVMQRNHFLCEFGRPGIQDNNDTIVLYNKFSHADDDPFMNYIKNELLSKRDFPKHSKRLGKKISESIFELYENARTHGRCKQIHTCGQYYPNKIPKRLDITIVDMGKTIKANVNAFLKDNLTGADAIMWALEYGNTTKTGNISDEKAYETNN